MTDTKKINRMRELAQILDNASDAYYNGEEIMSNFEYDKLYDELVALETSTGVVLPDSPTGKAGAEVVDSLPKYKHEYVALSLAKTKDIDEFVTKFKEHIESNAHMMVYNKTISTLVVLMWKMDGSTVQLYYDKGKLIHAVTRGNGEIGSIIDHNAPYIKGIPTTIKYKGKLVVRGEAFMTYTEFNRINSTLPVDEQYKNARNLANATISLLDSNEMRQREIQFHAFELVEKKDTVWDLNNHDVNKIWFNNMEGYFNDRLEWLKAYGFQVVEHVALHYSKLKDEMQAWEKRVPTLDFPVDGLVAAMDDTGYSKNLPGTGHNPHIMKGYAFKWKDETEKTTLREIEWSASRTGLLNPVAIFDPVELEGTTVSRASVHNISYIQNMDLKIGDTVSIAKMNKIIPAVVENANKETPYPTLTEDEMRTRHSIATKCPVCGQDTVIEHTVGGTKSIILMCTNPDCAAKHVGKFVHFCERDCMNIIGMSEATIEKFVDCGIITKYTDFFNLDKHPEIATMEGFGEKSWKKMIEAAENAQNNADFVGILHAMGISNVGKGQAKLLKTAIEKWANEKYPDEEKDYFDCLKEMSKSYDFETIEGFGKVIAESLKNWLNDNLIDGSDFNEMLGMMPKHMVAKVSKPVTSSISGKTFVITGSVEHFKNREELKEKIESLGGKTSGSVSAKTDYLINNDVTSTSGKNKKAKDLGVKIISEADFLALIGE